MQQPDTCHIVEYLFLLPDMTSFLKTINVSDYAWAVDDYNCGTCGHYADTFEQACALAFRLRAFFVVVLLLFLRVRVTYPYCCSTLSRKREFEYVLGLPARTYSHATLTSPLRQPTHLSAVHADGNQRE